jgi:hypothetical protein
MPKDVPGIGHNSGEDLVSLDTDIIREQLGIDYADMVARRDALCANMVKWAERFKNGITTEDEAGKSSDFASQMQKLMKAAEAERKARKQPFDAAGDEVQRFFARGIIDLLKPNVDKIAKAVKRYADDKAAKAREEANRIRQEQEAEAQRLAKLAREQQSETLMTQAANALDEADEAAKVVNAPAAELSRVRSDLGTLASSRSNWTFEVTDKQALCRAIADGLVSAEFVEVSSPAVRAHIQFHKKDGKYDGPEVPGLRIFNDEKVSFR